MTKSNCSNERPCTPCYTDQGICAVAMTTFIGTQAVSAVAMTRGEYNEYRGWSIPANENPMDQGYLFENKELASNDERHAGYISWLSKNEFEKIYHQSANKADTSHVAKMDINERPELEAVARAEMIHYLKENHNLYETLYDELSNRMDADATEEEVEEELEQHISDMFVFAFQAVQEKLSEQK